MADERHALRALEQRRRRTDRRALDLRAMRRAARAAVHHLLALRRGCRECIAVCQMRVSRRAAWLRARSSKLNAPCIFKRLHASVGQTPTALSANIRAEVQPSALAAQLHRLQIVTCVV